MSGGGGEGDSARGSEAGSGGAGDSLVRMEMAALPEEDLFPVYVTWVLSGSQLAFRIIGESNTVCGPHCCLSKAAPWIWRICDCVLQFFVIRHGSDV